MSITGVQLYFSKHYLTLLCEVFGTKKNIVKLKNISVYKQTWSQAVNSRNMKLAELKPADLILSPDILLSEQIIPKFEQLTVYHKQYVDIKSRPSPPPGYRILLSDYPIYKIASRQVHYSPFPSISPSIPPTSEYEVTELVDAQRITGNAYSNTVTP